MANEIYEFSASQFSFRNCSYVIIFTTHNFPI